MKKALLTLLAGLVGMGLALAQDRSLFVSVQGGGLLSLGENYFSYGENGALGGLFSAQGSAAVGYNLSDRYAVRMSVGYGGNSGAKNTRETAGHSFYPYRYSSVNAFVDLMVDPRGKHPVITSFEPKVYVGLGYGYTYGFHDTNDNYHWQKITDPNHAFGFRLGGAAFYSLSRSLSLFADLCVEAYTDNYNGLRPSDADKVAATGYPGFPFDLRPTFSAGLRISL